MGDLSKRQRLILADLLEEHDRVQKLRHDGYKALPGVTPSTSGMLSLRRLKTSNAFMRQMCLEGLVDGYGSRDGRGTGNTPDSSWWKITDAGRQALQASD